MVSHKVGLEIEAIGISPSRAAKIIQESTGIQCDYKGYCHKTSEHWKVVTDQSLPDESKCFEVVSPPLTEDRFHEVKPILRALRKAGVSVNGSCGLHVHVDISNMTDATVKNIFYRYAKHEHKIDDMLPYTRSNNDQYAKSIREHMDEVAPARFNENEYLYNIYPERYWKLNPQSITKYGTIEFRQHHGTTDSIELENWVRWIKGFVTASEFPTRKTIIHPGDHIGYQKLIEGLDHAEIAFIDNILMRAKQMGSMKVPFESELVYLFSPYLNAFLKKLRSKGFFIRLVYNSYDEFVLNFDKGTRRYAEKPIFKIMPEKGIKKSDNLWNGIDKDIKDFYTARKTFYSLG